MSLWSRLWERMLARAPRRVRAGRGAPVNSTANVPRELLATGMSREVAATGQVACRFGNPLRWREQSSATPSLAPVWFDLDPPATPGFRSAHAGRKNATVAAAAVASAVARARGVRSRILAGGRWPARGRRRPCAKPEQLILT